MIIGYMLTALLLPIGLTSAAYGAVHFGQIPQPETVDYLASKSLSWWFVSMALFSIASWTAVFKWLLNQLAEQRKANTLSTTELISYMKNDHTDTKLILQKVVDVLERIEKK